MLRLLRTRAFLPIIIASLLLLVLAVGWPYARSHYTGGVSIKLHTLGERKQGLEAIQLLADALQKYPRATSFYVSGSPRYHEGQRVQMGFSLSYRPLTQQFDLDDGCMSACAIQYFVCGVTSQDIQTASAQGKSAYDVMYHGTTCRRKP